MSSRTVSGKQALTVASGHHSLDTIWVLSEGVNRVQWSSLRG